MDLTHDPELMNALDQAVKKAFKDPEIMGALDAAVERTLSRAVHDLAIKEGVTEEEIWARLRRGGEVKVGIQAADQGISAIGAE